MSVSKGNYPIALIPFSRLTPAACAALSSAIDDTLQVFKKWRLPNSTRIANARDLLLRVAASDSYGTTDKELREVASAIQVANDFYVISRTLQGGRAEPIAQELKEALGGSLNRAAASKAIAFDIQTQFWLGTVLAHSGLPPAVPDDKTQRPDFVISVGTLRCAVEIKRPRSEPGAVRRLHAAASQLRAYGEPGIIVLDLSDCLNVDALVLHRGSPSARSIIKSQFFPMVGRLASKLENYSLSNKFERVIMLVMYTRFFNWIFASDRDADTGFFFKLIIRPEGCSGLVVDQSRRIEQSLLRGFERISGNQLSLRLTTN